MWYNISCQTNPFFVPSGINTVFESRGSVYSRGIGPHVFNHNGSRSVTVKGCLANQTSRHWSIFTTVSVSSQEMSCEIFVCAFILIAFGGAVVQATTLVYTGCTSKL